MQFLGLCPFHSEDTPSFSVSPGKQIFYCFGCHKGGDVIHFIREIEKVPYRRAIEILAERVGVKLPEIEEPRQKEIYKKRERLIAANTEAARYFYHALNDERGAAARDYLARRGISTPTARRFGLGYAPDEWSGLLEHLQSKGFTEAEIQDSGLFRLNRSNRLYDLFRDRLMFPIIDITGRIVAFGGRILGDGQPKYINSPETPVYVKGQTLYGLNVAKKSRAAELVLVEGYMDVIAMHQAGFDNVVAALGTALTERQVRLMRRYTNEVIVGFDADRAGQEAAARSFELLEQQDFKIRVLVMPEGKDPDEYIQQNGSERFRAVLEAALPLLDYRFYRIEQAYTSDGRLDLLGYQEEACRLLLTIDNAIVYELYLSKVAQKLGTLVDAVRREVDRLRRKRTASPPVARGELRPRETAREADEPSEPDAYEALPKESGLNENEAYFLALLSRNPGVRDNLGWMPVYLMFTDASEDGFPARALEAFQEGRLTPTLLLNLAEDFTCAGQPLRDRLAGALVRLPDHLHAEREQRDLERLAVQINLAYVRARRDWLAVHLDDPNLDRATLVKWRKQLEQLNHLYNGARKTRINRRFVKSL